jgi:hypothetical protein
MKTNTEFKNFMIKRTDGRPVGFKGIVLGRSDESFNNAHPGYSGRVGRADSLILYKTSGGNYVAQWDRDTCWQGERSTTEVEVCKNLEQVMDFFGHSRLAQELYADANLEEQTCEEVA